MIGLWIDFSIKMCMNIHSSVFVPLTKVQYSYLKLNNNARSPRYTHYTHSPSYPSFPLSSLYSIQEEWTLDLLPWLCRLTLRHWTERKYLVGSLSSFSPHCWSHTSDRGKIWRHHPENNFIRKGAEIGEVGLILWEEILKRAHMCNLQLGKYLCFTRSSSEINNYINEWINKIYLFLW